jgi:hypothetical protein
MIKRYGAPIIGAIIIICLFWVPIWITRDANGWWDAPQHFFAGIAFGVGGLWLYRLSGRFPRWLKRLSRWIGMHPIHIGRMRMKRQEDPEKFRRIRWVLWTCAALVGGWEWYEYFQPYINNPFLPNGEPQQFWDTVSDMLFGMLGGYVSLWIGRLFGALKRAALALKLWYTNITQED